MLVGSGLLFKGSTLLHWCVVRSENSITLLFVHLSIIVRLTKRVSMENFILVKRCVLCGCVRAIITVGNCIHVCLMFNGLRCFGNTGLHLCMESYRIFACLWVRNLCLSWEDFVQTASVFGVPDGEGNSRLWGFWLLGFAYMKLLINGLQLWRLHCQNLDHTRRALRKYVTRCST
jgi:hypothetical protein